LHKRVENSLREDSKLTISLCKRNTDDYSPLEQALKLTKIGNSLYIDLLAKIY
jgi:hypothetical protein